MADKENNSEAGPEVIKTSDFMTNKKEFIIFLSNDDETEYNLSLELNNEQIIILLTNNDDV